MSVRRLVIAMIGQKGLPLGPDSGGIERHVEELGTRLAARGHEVLVYVRPRYATEHDRGWRGMRLIRAWSLHTKATDTLTHVFFSTLDAIARGVDVFHYHGVGPATLAWMPRVFAPRARVVVTFHSIDRLHQKWGAFARLYLRFGEWASCRYPHVTVAVSHVIQEYCRKRYHRECVRIPNGATIPDHPGTGLLRQWGLEPGSYILTVARLVRQKGIHHLITAFDGFEKEKKLVIVGGSEAHASYARELRDMSEGNSAIVFTGFQQGRALEQLFANAYLYVQPSESEGLPVSVLEALAAGRCALVSDIPENIESIDHSGLTFISTDADDLRLQLRRLLNHPELVEERGKRGRDWVRMTFDWDRIAERMEREVYARVDASERSG